MYRPLIDHISGEGRGRGHACPGACVLGGGLCAQGACMPRGMHAPGTCTPRGHTCPEGVGCVARGMHGTHTHTQPSVDRILDTCRADLFHVPANRHWWGSRPESIIPLPRSVRPGRRSTDYVTSPWLDLYPRVRSLTERRFKFSESLKEVQ